MRDFKLWYNRNMEDAEYNRLGVLAFILLIHTCILIPATLLLVNADGFNYLAMAITSGFSFAILFSMIACLPVKITLPLFAVSTLVHVFMIALA